MLLSEPKPLNTENGMEKKEVNADFSKTTGNAVEIQDNTHILKIIAPSYFGQVFVHNMVRKIIHFLLTYVSLISFIFIKIVPKISLDVSIKDAISLRY